MRSLPVPGSEFIYSGATIIGTPLSFMLLQTGNHFAASSIKHNTGSRASLTLPWCFRMGSICPLGDGGSVVIVSVKCCGSSVSETAILWGLHAQCRIPGLQKKVRQTKKDPVSGSSGGDDTMLLRVIRREWPDSLKWRGMHTKML